ncbi:BRCA1-associated protein-like isoform X2 [Gigantopelta aegis]|uniref:BRCA1-associated protein-like isoform X2 n=1 Tax=Gigantopelta aegis TaxID=1735272 RepID=UPI001B887AD4|nr:BRCA1-associated protein-like isoform X2 [Gigantopelta aegis]
MLISLVVLRLEIADNCQEPTIFKPYSAPLYQLCSSDYTDKSHTQNKLSYAAVTGIVRDSPRLKTEDLHRQIKESTGLREHCSITLETYLPSDPNTSEENESVMSSDEPVTPTSNVKPDDKPETDHEPHTDITVTEKDNGTKVRSTVHTDCVPGTSHGGSVDCTTSEADKVSRVSTSRESSLTHDDPSGERRTSGTVLPKSHSPTPRLPSSIHFFSGNPCVERTKGILHIYKDGERKSLDAGVARSEMICMLGVPGSYMIHDLLQFVAPMRSESNSTIEYMRIIRNATPNQYMVLLKFRDQTSADQFYENYNNEPYNSIESNICHLVYVARVEIMKESEGAMLPIPGLTELPNCPVCLERMDESVDGILTVLCNHAFHTSCIAKWGDTSCPVCRYCQTPEEVADNRCMNCGSHESLWICLICGHVGCGRYVELHAYRHFQDTNHTYVMQLGSNQVWDYAGDNYVHRLVQNKSDGKLVEVDEGGNLLREEKVDSLTLEYTYLLTTQLESQRQYFEKQMQAALKEADEKVEEAQRRWSATTKQLGCIENQLADVTKEKQGLDKKCTQYHSRLVKVLKDLQEEKEMNQCLRDNQQLWQKKVSMLEEKLELVSQDKDKSYR